MVSIRQIAKKSGYSPSTVSRYLNKSGYISEKAAAEIQGVIADLNYVPNQIARDLSKGLTRRIAVVIPHTRHPYFIEIIRGLLEASQSSQYQLLLLPSDYDEQLEQSYLEQLRSKFFDALIFTSRAVSIESIASYTSYGHIVCFEEVDDPRISSVYVDRSSGYRDLFQWLKRRDISHMALLFSRNDSSSNTYRETMAYFHHYLASSYVTFGNLSTYEDADSISQTLWQDSKLDCILANSDDLAIGLKKAYEDHHLPSPLIVSQESQLSGHLYHIPSINNHPYQLGQKAFDVAISSEKQKIRIASSFVNRS